MILVECSGGETPGSHVADAVALVVKSGECQPEAKDDRKQKWGRTRLLNLLLKQLSGIPLRDTVVNGTRQSGFERFFWQFLFFIFCFTIRLCGRVVVVYIPIPVLSVLGRSLKSYVNQISFTETKDVLDQQRQRHRSTKFQLFTETCLISSTKAEIRASICTACRENT